MIGGHTYTFLTGQTSESDLKAICNWLVNYVEKAWDDPYAMGGAIFDVLSFIVPYTKVGKAGELSKLDEIVNGFKAGAKTKIAIQIEKNGGKFSKLANSLDELSSKVAGQLEKYVPELVGGLDNSKFANKLDDAIKWASEGVKTTESGKIINKFIPEKVILENGETAFISSEGVLVRSPEYLDDLGRIKWPEANGFVVDKAGNAITFDANLKKGQLLDRYGNSGGTFTSPLENGKPMRYDSRGLPYPESAMEYHKYEIVKDINLQNIQEAFSKMSLRDQRELLKAMEDYKFNFEQMANPQSGKISEVFGVGGGTQIQFSTSVSWYEKLGLLREVG